MRPITGANGNIGTAQKEGTTNKKRKEILKNYIKQH
jgi:hypothetical protein